MRKRALFQALGYEPHPGQALVHRSHAPRRILCCGVRWGKSTCAAMECIAALMEPRERTLGWVVAPTLELTRRTFERVVRTIRASFENRIIEYSPREHCISVRNLGGGVSELKAKTADRPDGLLGEGIDFLVIDEAANVREGVWDEYLAPRLIDRKGWSLIISTPRGQGWFQREFRRAKRDPDYERWQAPTSENPRIDLALIEAERGRLDADTFAQQYEGRFTGPPEPCPVCHGPSPRAEGCTVRLNDDLVLKCSECGMPVDKRGFTLVKLTEDGKMRFSVARLICPDPTPEEMAGFEDWTDAVQRFERDPRAA